MYLLGYDIGSSSIKVALIDGQNRDVLSVIQYPDQEMEMISRQRGWAEQQPELWWQHLCVATRKIISQNDIDPENIKGIGIGYQMHGLVLIDKDLQVLRPAIIWCDSRAVPIGEQAFKEIGEEYCLQHYLNSPGNFTASKLKWVKDNEPDIYGKIYKIMLPGDYISMKFTGNVTSTISGLSEGVLWDFKDKKIADKLIRYYELEPSMIPDIIPTLGLSGTISKMAAEQCGLALGTQVTYKAGDQPNNAMSLNVLKPGEIAATSGTSGVVYGVVDRPLYDPQSRVNAFAHVNYDDQFDKIGILLCINGAGIQYGWIKNQIARSGRSYEDMERMVASVPVGSEGVCILPFGNGAERMLGNKNLGSHIFNLEFNRHSRAHLFRAALEGVAFSFAYGVEILKELGLNVDIIRVGNDNMFRSKVFATTISTLLNCQIQVVDTTGAIGAARASGVKAGLYRSIEEAFQEIEPEKVYTPQPAFGTYQHAYNYWRNKLENQMIGASESNIQMVKILEKNSQYKEEIRRKNKEIAINTVRLDTMASVIDEISKTVDKTLYDAKIPELKTLSTKLHGLINNIDLVGHEVFEENINLVSDNFVTNLKNKFPLLSFDELKLCTFLKLNLSSKEIASKLNLSVRGVETKRYRIRKKLALEKGKNLVAFLNSV